MRPIAKRLLAAAVVLVVVPALFSGCIVCVDDLFCDNRPPRMATLHVYVMDYYTGAPIPWASVEIYERNWWSWDFIGAWPVGGSGYVIVPVGYLYYDGYGGSDEEDFRVVTRASGYYSEEFVIELSYYYSSETLTFYLVPWQGREGDAAGKLDDAPEPTDVFRPEGKVVKGAPDGAEVSEDTEDLE